MTDVDMLAYWRVQASHWQESALLYQKGERAALERVRELETQNAHLTLADAKAIQESYFKLVSRVYVLEFALREIEAIKDPLYGCDWDAVKEAHKIARKALEGKP